MKQKGVIFDLDDTLYKEIYFLKSAFKHICSIYLSVEETTVAYDNMMKWYHKKENVFEKFKEEYQLKIELPEFLKVYRDHFPDISLTRETSETLEIIKSAGHKVGLITDGYSKTQRNKIRALGLEGYFDQIVISEEFGSGKPAINNYTYFDSWRLKDFCYIGDNITKDFLSPNRLGWASICLLDNGQNIHQQNFDIAMEYLPKYKISCFGDCIKLINTN